MSALGHLIDLPELPEGLRLRGPIGIGAAGSCYSVTDITDQALALKIVSEKWEERELESIRAFRKIPSHPALAQIFSSGKLADGRFYYTMELADNAGSEAEYQADTLAHRIKNRILPLPEILRILSAVASGAEHLHKHGLFHGDIKPENILFVNGSPKLADFGTLSSRQSGTAGFYPENPISGADRDCYALGMTLYCAWSGRDASDFPDPPETYDPDEWRRVRKIYLRACNTVARRRFASASDLITVLEEAAQPPRPPAKRYRLLTAAALLFLIVLSVPAVRFFRTKEVQPRGWMASESVLIEERNRALAEYGVTVTPTPEGRFRLRDPEYRENDGVCLINSSWYSGINGKRYLEVKRWMRENPEEAARIRAEGIDFFPDPEYGLQYKDSRNGFRGVGSLADLVEYRKHSPRPSRR